MHPEVECVDAKFYLILEEMDRIKSGVVSDDASVDRTLEIVASYQEKIEIPIRIYHHEPNGIGANWKNSCEKKS